MNGFKGFAYTYDSMGRLTDAQMFISSLSQNKPLIGTTREQITYDKNSNVVQLKDSRGLSPTTRNYSLQGNKISNITINNEEKGACLYDERGNMTQNTEAGLQMSYNLCNLPKQITTVNGKTVKYTYCAGDPVNLVDPDGEKPRIYIQGGGVGHVFLSVGDGRNIIIYSYGRYGTLHEFLGRTWGSANPTGEGVMYKYEGEEAYEFLNEHKAEIMAVFEVNSNDDSRIMSYYDAQLDPNKRPTNKSKKSYYDKNAYVIDAFHIIKNNCVKKTLEGVNLVNTYIDGNYTMPASLHYALIQKTRENGSYITEISINDILNYSRND